MDRFLTMLPGLLLGLVFANFVFRDDPDRLHLRAFLMVALLVGAVFVHLGSAGLVAGPAVTLLLPLVYFSVLEKRQYSLRDLIFFLLSAGCLAAAAAQVARTY